MSSLNKSMSKSLARMSQTYKRNSAYSRYVRFQNRKKPGLDPEQLEELREAFNLFDTDHSGQVDAREFKAAMRALGYDIRKADVIQAFGEVEKDISETLNFEEFVKVIAPKLAAKDSRAEIMKVFKLFDEDGTGKISFKNIKKISQELGTPALMISRRESLR